MRQVQPKKNKRKKLKKKNKKKKTWADDETIWRPFVGLSRYRPALRQGFGGQSYN